MTTLQGDPTRERIATLIRRTLSGKVARYEGPYKSQTSQKIIDATALFAPILGPAGTVLGGVGIVEDVTERSATRPGLPPPAGRAPTATRPPGWPHETTNRPAKGPR